MDDRPSFLRSDLEIIAAHVAEGTRVLDIGCGEGALMAALRDKKKADARGIEIDGQKVAIAVGCGLSVIQGDADRDLAAYPDNSFDYAILSQTLQTTRAPHQIMEQLLRIAPRAFVSFPNFGYWRVRWSLLSRGRMPITKTLPTAWYDTPNIHHLTIKDFHDFVKMNDIVIEKSWYLSDKKLMLPWGANLRAEQAVFLLTKQGVSKS